MAGASSAPYLRLLRQSDLRTIQNSYTQLFQLNPPSRRALEDTLSSNRWLTLAAVAPDPSSPSRQEYMGGFVLSVVADVAEFVAAPDDEDPGESGEEDSHGAAEVLHSDDDEPPRGTAGRPMGRSAGAQQRQGRGGGGGAGGSSVGVHASGLNVLGLPRDERVVNICLLGVLPSYRRRGLARLMLRQVVDSARKASASAVFLHVRPGNTAAIALYRAVGFVPIAVVPRYYDTPGSGGLSGGAELQQGWQQQQQQEQVVGPVAAGGDAVLLVLPLSEAAAAATATAGATVAAAVAEAIEAAVRQAAAGVAAGSTPTAGAPPGSSTQQGQQESLSAPAVNGNRFVGRSTAASTSNTTSSNSNASGGSRLGLFGVLTAAATGAVGGLAALLPGGVRRGPGGRGGAGAAVRQVEVGGEVLQEVAGADGEVYLTAPVGEQGAGQAGEVGEAGTVSVTAGVKELGDAGEVEGKHGSGSGRESGSSGGDGVRCGAVAGVRGGRVGAGLGAGGGCGSGVALVAVVAGRRAGQVGARIGVRWMGALRIGPVAMGLRVNALAVAGRTSTGGLRLLGR